MCRERVIQLRRHYERASIEVVVHVATATTAEQKYMNLLSHFFCWKAFAKSLATRNNCLRLMISIKVEKIHARRIWWTNFVVEISQFDHPSGMSLITSTDMLKQVKSDLSGFCASRAAELALTFQFSKFHLITWALAVRLGLVEGI